METVLLAADTLTRFIVIRSDAYPDKGYVHYDSEGFAVLGEKSVFSTEVKIEAERATVNDRYVNLRFCNSNKYWQRQGQFIVAVSSKPEEDTTKASCTLFEAVSVAGDDGLFYLIHVQSGGRLLITEREGMRFYVDTGTTYRSHLSFVNWSDLVKLPENVAFKGYNDEYLGGIVLQGYNYLRFSFDDPNAQACGQEIHLIDDGYIRVKSKHYNRFWRRSPNWILGDSNDTTTGNKDTLFWPIKIDETTIALKNAGNGLFCKALTADGKTNCLNASADTAVIYARLVVEELVLSRSVFNVRYRMEDSRIYNETVFIAGTTTAENKSDSEAAIGVEVSYEDEISYSFSNSLSLTLASKITFKAGVPFIASTEVEVGAEITNVMEWGETQTTRKGVKATGSVPVPPRTMATVSYVGTTGTCDVPFTYTLEVRRSTDGVTVESSHTDGVCKGVNNYNFYFVIEKTQPL